MIRVISGTIFDTTHQHIVVLTAAGVGYGISTLATHTVHIGDTVTLYTHLAVRETALDLYGFADSATRDFFELLLTIPKVGPKSALQILNQAEVSTIIEAVQTEDAGFLSKVSGIGKKTAENIVLGLKGKIDSSDFTPTAPLRSEYQDAFDALLSFGYPATDIRRVLDSLSEASTSDLITQALKELR
jgi:Holliday junction DNA helicase RuvA